jgi:tRNA uridine 5-carboxymethylaminomethyl modification enzyme
MMPCNPSIGGPAKGVVVREIDALGGEMATAADATYLQMKMLNTAKGPGVQCLRAQSDKLEYKAYMQKVLRQTPYLTIVEDMVTSLVVEGNRCCGVVLSDGTSVLSQAVILTTGTSLEAKILIGHTAESAGPDGEKAAHGLSKHLKALGIPLMRLKTGTPARIQRDTVDFSQMEIQPGTPGDLAFSYETKTFIPVEEQHVCYLIHTTPKTHQIIRDNLSKSAMYGGMVEGVGPRYCPSIEDKLVRFADKESHQLFIEPESVHLNTVYLQGFSTSMPKEVQEQMEHSLPGFENSKILKYAYAIEYDAFDPTALKPSLESKHYDGLFLAGQINGTSGYEEAAAQGLIAAINATRKLEKKAPLILKRSEAYIGVMIDDLTTKGTKEPYRLLTSRAEFRLLLRHDNADLRLRKYGYESGLVSEDLYRAFLQKQTAIETLTNVLQQTMFSSKHPINHDLQARGFAPIQNSLSAAQLLKRPEHDFSLIRKYLTSQEPWSNEVIQQVEIAIKYEGYIKKQLQQVEAMNELEDIALPPDMDYQKIPNLAIEARQKLNKIRPLNIGQASRISGVNPSDIGILAMYLKLTKEG